MRNNPRKVARKILVVSPAWVGDLILSQSVYIELARQGAEVHVLAPPWAQALLARMPEVALSHPMPATHGELKLTARYHLAQTLRTQQYDQAIILPRSLKAALIPWLAKIPLRTGYRGEMRFGLINDMRCLCRDEMPRIVERFVNLTRAQADDMAPDNEMSTNMRSAITVAPPALRVATDNLACRMRELGLLSDQRALAIMPGAAYGASKRWPPKYFSTVARTYLDQGWQIWIFGSSSDQAAADAVAKHLADDGQNRQTNKVFNLCGKTELPDVIDLLSGASFAVTNDSGLMHIAAAVGCPLVAMYGATAMAYTPPMTATATQMQHPIACAPCRQTHLSLRPLSVSDRNQTSRRDPTNRNLTPKRATA